MILEAVPPGTGPVAALALRGPDPNLVTPTGSPLDTCLGASLNAVAAAAATRHVKYSSVAGLMAGYFYTRDPLVLTELLSGAVPSDTKLLALWNHFRQNGVDATTAL